MYLLVGGDKTGLHDVWYDAATNRAEAMVDQLIRLRTTPKGLNQ